VACSEQRWQSCLDSLDEAKKLDPAGDESPAVKGLREKADGGLLDAPTAVPTNTARAPQAPAVKHERARTAPTVMPGTTSEAPTAKDDDGASDSFERPWPTKVGKAGKKRPK
jgi:hypothetical protein